MITVVRKLRTRDFHDVPGVVYGGLAEDTHAVTAWIVLFFHHHIKGAVFGHQTNRLAIAEALLSAVTMLFAVLAHLQVAG